MEKFKHFFNSCEQGFKNEFVIQLYARIYMPQVEIQAYGREADEVVLIEQGSVDLLLRDGTKFMSMPELSVFNDY